MPNVKLFASLRKIAGVKEAVIPGSSAGAVVAELVRVYPALANHLQEGDQLQRHVIITINGQPTDNLNAPVTAGDVVAIFPPIAGG